MENQQKNKFFNSKTNGILLLVLIVLMVIALLWMLKDREKYFAFLGGDKEVVEEQKEVEEKEETIKPEVKDTYTYVGYGMNIDLPNGYTPRLIEGETGPTLSIELPNKSYIIYITDATWWEEYNIKNQADYLKDETIGVTKFRVYQYKDQKTPFYYFRQGNVAYIFWPDAKEYAKTFKFVGWPKVEKEVKVTSKLQTIFNSLNSKSSVMIEECGLGGKIYYRISMNAYDAGSYVVDVDGKTVGSTSGLNGKSSGLAELEYCNTVYVNSPNIWGEKSVNVYNLI